MKRQQRKCLSTRSNAMLIYSLPSLSLHLLSIYKKAGIGKEKREVTYVVTKKGASGKKVRRPPGVKGAFKVVDSRMKKDMRGMQRKEQRAKGGKGRRQPNGGKGAPKGGKMRKGR